ncbi:hypothetical protein [Methanoculleus chikugoensis]|uniref:hypothetical protein n=1 Tax=Methanoculleus chikugoensis TaxID=118126 RepID=UPI001FB1B76F|nr:hypothetical protein [Methanoculleus chikugoensis]
MKIRVRERKEQDSIPGKPIHRRPPRPLFSCTPPGMASRTAASVSGRSVPFFPTTSAVRMVAAWAARA